MTGFSITLSEDSFDLDGGVFALGSLSLGPFQEDFHASQSYWDRDKYRAQWRDGLNRLVNGESRSALVTSMYDPGTAGHIFWWPLYATGNNIHAQNQILFLDDLGEPFDETDLYRFTQKRETMSEDGQPISEWTMKLSDIEIFLRSPSLAAR